MIKLIALLSLVFFTASGLPLQNFQQSSNDQVDLRQVVQQVQNFSNHSESESNNFSEIFRSTVFTLQAVVGLKTFIVNKTDSPDAGTPLIIVCINIPYLVPSAISLSKDISSYQLNNSDILISDTSFIPSIETPPPIV